MSGLHGIENQVMNAWGQGDNGRTKWTVLWNRNWRIDGLLKKGRWRCTFPSATAPLSACECYERSKHLSSPVSTLHSQPHCKTFTRNFSYYMLVVFEILQDVLLSTTLCTTAMCCIHNTSDQQTALCSALNIAVWSFSAFSCLAQYWVISSGASSQNFVQVYTWENNHLLTEAAHSAHAIVMDFAWAKSFHCHIH